MNKQTWTNGISEEYDFWNYWLTSAGIYWPDDYNFRIRNDTELQEEFRGFLLGKVHPRIMDVGAGPLSFLGKRMDGVPVEIVPVDALAEMYNVLLHDHGIFPPVRTLKWDSEELSSFPAQFGKFNLIVAQNTLDHSYDPVKAILSMPSLLNPSGTIWLKHYINEGERGKYGGLHQWNFFMDHDSLIIGSTDHSVNLTELFKSQFSEFTHEFHFTPFNEIVNIFKR